MKREDGPVELGRSEDGGIEALYQNEQNYLRVMTAANGSITTAYLLSSRDLRSEWQISTVDAKIAEDLYRTTLLPKTMIWIREGNNNAGLKHIHLEFAQAFEKKMGYANIFLISQFIHETMTTHDPFDVTSVDRITVVTYMTGDDYLIVRIAPSGFIISAFLQAGSQPLWSITTTAAKITGKGLLTPNIIILVEGVGYRGLNYTYEQHGKEFKDIVGADGTKEISTFIKKVMVEKQYPQVQQYFARCGRIDTLYQIIENQQYLRVSIGRSGYITTAFPIPNMYVEWIITTDQAGINEAELNTILAQNIDATLCNHHTIFLEEGNSRGARAYGVKNIFKGHGTGFIMLSEKIRSERDMSTFIRETMERNTPNQITSNTPGLIDVCYPIISSKYLKVVIRRDGCIVTAYVTSSLDVEWEIKIDQTKISKAKMDSKLNLKAHALKRIYARDVWYPIKIDSEEDVSNFIKTTLKDCEPHEVIEGQTGGINVLYMTHGVNLLIMISTEGTIEDIVMRAQQCILHDDNFQGWSITTNEAGIKKETIEFYTHRDALLRYSHIIYINKFNIARIYAENFEGKTLIHSPNDLSKTIWSLMKHAHHPLQIKAAKEIGMMDLSYGIYTMEETLILSYLHVIIAGTGNIFTAFIAKQP